MKLFSAMDKVLRIACAGLMGAMTLAVILSVFFRYVFSMTTAWSEELITMLFIATTFLGTAMVTQDEEHISIDLLQSRLSPRLAGGARLLVSLTVIAVQGIVFQASLRWIAVNGELRTPGLELPFRWFYALLPLSCVLVGLVEIGKIYRSVRVLAVKEVTP